MKKMQYIQPSAEAVNVKLLGSLLGGEPMHGPSVKTDHVDAKESLEIENEDVLPSQKSLWDDED